jgi:hypothetical protein
MNRVSLMLLTNLLVGSMAIAQDPGVTLVTLDALVANSVEVSLVVVTTAEQDGNGPLKSLELEVQERLKRKISLPDRLADVSTDTPSEKVRLSSVRFTKDELKSIRIEGQGYWSYDLSEPFSDAAGKELVSFREKKSQLLYFREFQSFSGTTLHYFVPLNGPVTTAEWKTLSGAELVIAKTRDLVNRYRGVEKMATLLLEISCFRETLATMTDGTSDKLNIPGRGIIVPFDEHFAELLIAFVQEPDGLYDDSFTTRRENWLTTAKYLYSFENEANRNVIKTLLADPKIGKQQNALLKEILGAWHRGI